MLSVPFPWEITVVLELQVAHRVIEIGLREGEGVVEQRLLELGQHRQMVMVVEELIEGWLQLRHLLPLLYLVLRHAWLTVGPFLPQLLLYPSAAFRLRIHLPVPAFHNF